MGSTKDGSISPAAARMRSREPSASRRWSPPSFKVEARYRLGLLTRAKRSNLSPPSAGHAGGRAGLVSSTSESLEYLDTADHRIVSACLGKRDGNLTGCVRRGGELFGDRLVRTTGGGEDIERAQHVGTVNGHVELPLPRGRPAQLRKVQPCSVRRARL